MSTIATQIRDAMFGLITNPALFTWKSTRKVPVPPVQIDQLPALGVYLIRETMGPQGDSDHSIPRYDCDGLFGIMVISEASKPDVLEGSMDSLVDLIENTILQSNNGFFLNLRDNGTNIGGNNLVRAVPTITRTYDFPKEGETQYIQCRLQMTVQYQLEYPPVIANDFGFAIVTVQPPNQSNLAGVAPTESDNFTAEFETSPPQVTITTIGGFTNNASVSLTGTALPGSDITSIVGKVYVWDSNLPVPIGFATPAGGNWSVTVTLAALGQRSLYATCSDNLGNTGKSKPAIFTLVTGTP